MCKGWIIPYKSGLGSKYDSISAKIFTTFFISATIIFAIQMVLKLGK